MAAGVNSKEEEKSSRRGRAGREGAVCRAATKRCQQLFQSLGSSSSSTPDLSLFSHFSSTAPALPGALGAVITWAVLLLGGAGNIPECPKSQSLEELDDPPRVHSSPREQHRRVFLGALPGPAGAGMPGLGDPGMPRGPRAVTATNSRILQPCLAGMGNKATRCFPAAPAAAPTRWGCCF